MGWMRHPWGEEKKAPPPPVLFRDTWESRKQSRVFLPCTPLWVHAYLADLFYGWAWTSGPALRRIFLKDIMWYHFKKVNVSKNVKSWFLLILLNRWCWKENVTTNHKACICHSREVRFSYHKQTTSCDVKSQIIGDVCSQPPLLVLSNLGKLLFNHSWLECLNWGTLKHLFLCHKETAV